ncbi:MAG TPA: methylated-DNA--[protein]-cysteine S-methyltransferase [Burkholderiaceae bacterium]|nr:methylated-DNA--[protein]-cysteine S-methyltransferase [Burkholderiaceae bacterium]
MTTPFDGVPLVARADLDTPLGAMTALATPRGLAGLWFDAAKYRPELAHVPEDPANTHIAAARAWLAAYWAGGDPAPGDVPLDLHGSAFQRAVWQALLAIPRGHTRTYGQIAAAVGAGAVARATGGAIGRNPVALIVPCHRVVGANGSLTGFAAGLPRKERLLQHEGALLA